MAGRQQRLGAWLGILLAGFLAGRGTPVAVAEQNAHCVPAAAAAGHDLHHHPSPAPEPACQPASPCSDGGAIPCPTVSHCTSVAVMAPAARDAQSVLDPGPARLPVVRPSRIVARTIPPPTPPPIHLL